MAMAIPVLRTLASGSVAWREAGSGMPLVLLHGIGSSSSSWAGQFDGLADRYRVIAWDAPGYGGSAPLVEALPRAGHYAAVFEAWVQHQALGPLLLVGHSLGAIVAAAAAARGHVQVRALVLASPARGYGLAAAEVREKKLRERIDSVDRLGIEGLAAQRSAALCAPGASAASIEAVRINMTRATPGGYKQAAQMLAAEDLQSHLRSVNVPLTVLCGEFDGVTPPKGCREIAAAAHAPYVELAGVGHACYVEDPARFNAALIESFKAVAAHG